MKRIVFLAIAAVVICTAFPIVALQTSQSSEPRTEENPEYSIEFLTPTVVRVRGLVIDWHDGEKGHGQSFAKAIQEVGKKYTIEQITPISYGNYMIQARTSSASNTKELILIVKPKN